MQQGPTDVEMRRMLLFSPKQKAVVDTVQYTSHERTPVVHKKLPVGNNADSSTIITNDGCKVHEHAAFQTDLIKLTLYDQPRDRKLTRYSRSHLTYSLSACSVISLFL